MAYEDRLSIVTPEGVVVDLTLAGLGSRIVAQLLDSFIKFTVIIVLAIATGILGSVLDRSSGLLIALFVIVNAILLIGYDVAFETMQNGRTPGKRAVGIRVVLAGGSPIGLIPSLIRNVLRLVDALPTFYLVAIVAVLASDRNQRLGDMAAGTIVVRDQARTAVPGPAPRPIVPDEVAAWDLTGLTPEELGAVRRFLERRADLAPQARYGLANDIAARLRPKVVGAPQDMPPERFLEWVAQAKATR